MSDIVKAQQGTWLSGACAQVCRSQRGQQGMQRAWRQAQGTCQKSRWERRRSEDASKQQKGSVPVERVCRWALGHCQEGGSGTCTQGDRPVQSVELLGDMPFGRGSDDRRPLLEGHPVGLTGMESPQQGGHGAEAEPLWLQAFWLELQRGGCATIERLGSGQTSWGRERGQ